MFFRFKSKTSDNLRLEEITHTFQAPDQNRIYIKGHGGEGLLELPYEDGTVRADDYEQLCEALALSPGAKAPDPDLETSSERVASSRILGRVREALGTPRGESVLDRAKYLMKELEAHRVRQSGSPADAGALSKVPAIVRWREEVNRLRDKLGLQGGDDLQVTVENLIQERRNIQGTVGDLSPNTSPVGKVRDICNEFQAVREGLGFVMPFAESAHRAERDRVLAWKAQLECLKLLQDKVREVLDCPEDEALLLWAESCKRSMDKAAAWEPELIEALNLLGVEWDATCPASVEPGARSRAAAIKVITGERATYREAAYTLGVVGRVAEVPARARALADENNRARLFYKAVKQHMDPEPGTAASRAE